MPAQPVSLAQWLGNPEPATVEDNPAAQVEIDSMAGRDENGLDRGSCPQAIADFFSFFISEHRRRSPARRGELIRVKRRFGTSDGRDVEENTGVGSEPHPPGMSNAVPIKECDIRQVLDFPESSHEGRDFSKRKEPGDVGKMDFRHLRSNLNNLEPGDLHHHHHSRDSVSRRRIAEIGPGDQ